MSTIAVNTTDYEIRRAREALAGFAGSIDAKRPASWEQYGYKADLTFDDFCRAYERLGPAHGAVHRILDGCWQSLPRIKAPNSDEVTPWESGVSALFSSLRLWAKLRDFDRRNMIGRYSGLIYRVADGKPLNQPIEKASKLVDVVPVHEGQLKVVAWHSDMSDAENYGKPAMFQYRRRNVVAHDTQGQPDEWADVHPSRVQILAEGSVGDMFDGVPLLRSGFNHLVDIEKISGGSGESFLKNSARTLVFKYERDASPQVIQAAGEPTRTVREAHEEQTRALNRNQDSSIVLQGGDATTLQTTISDPTGAFNLAANLFAASVRLPFTILFGQQTGRLASDEDKADAIARYKSRQANELTPMLEEFVRRMQAIGVIEQGNFVIEWPDIAAPSDEQKLKNLREMTAALREAFGAGVQGLFEADELRKVVGYEPLAETGAVE